MCSKFYFLLLIFLKCCQVIYTQNEALYCIFSGNYVCTFSIHNPNGFNNFTTINGTHLTAKNDESVLNVISTSTSITTNIPAIICEKFVNVQRIELVQIGINVINDYSLEYCQKLTYISLTKNKISEIDEKSFNNNLMLQNLYLHDNLITNIPENLFQNLNSLKVLRFQINNITDLPANIFKPLKNLGDLSFSRNKISKLRMEWFENLEKLTILWIYENPIEKFQENIFAPLKSLTSFYSQNNKLKVIHADSFGIHPNLKTISFDSNQINAIDERIIDNTNVTSFYMTRNICANINVTDLSPSRATMRTFLRQCFDNYNNQVIVPTTTTTTTAQDMTTDDSSGCIIGNLDNRVCKVENAVEDLTRENTILKEKLENQESSIDELTNENQRLASIIEDMQDNFTNRKTEVDAAMDEMQEQLLILSTRPCSCH